MSKTMGALSLGAVLLAAGPSQAQVFIQGIPGSGCATDSRTTAAVEYRNRKLRNTSSDPWAIAIAVCPVSLFVPGVDPREYRIIVNDPETRTSWCQAYNGNGALVRNHFTSGGGTDVMFGSLAALGSPAGLAEATFHCLLQSGASIERIEIVWYRP